MTNENHLVKLTRDCHAIMVPAGTPVLLQKDSEVEITQALGASFTISFNFNLFRIANEDADAIGREPQPMDLKPDGTVEEQAWAHMEQIYDPEIPVNIVALGLIYELKITELEDKTISLYVKMTLTAPGCGLGPTIQAEVDQRLRTIKNVSAVNVEFVFDPPWDQSMMSDEAKLQLNMFF